MITGDSKISGRTAHPTFTSPKVRLTWNSPKCSRPASAGLAEPFRAPRMRRIQVPRYTFGLHFLLLASIPCWAQGSASSDQGGWFARVARAQAAQPHWITPVVTVTPRLEEEFRYDIWEQTQPNGARLENYGGSKGPELIPTEHIQVTV